MSLNPMVDAVTREVVRKSERTRNAYLARMIQARHRGTQRSAPPSGRPGARCTSRELSSGNWDERVLLGGGNGKRRGCRSGRLDGRRAVLQDVRKGGDRRF